MKLRPVWTPEDAQRLQEAMAAHPVYSALQRTQPQRAELAPVIDITTRKRLA